MSKHYISCARCDKDIEITKSSDCHSSNIDGKLLCYDCWQKEQPKYLSDKVADLEAKLAESEERCTKMWKWELQQINRLQEENNQLKQQLAEKEEELKHKHWAIKSGVYIQDKISFAVDILEELADCSNYIDSKLDFESGSYVSENVIRDKIKYLKGNKYE